MTQQEVYLVSSGSYDDYGIDGVFDCKEKAQLFIKTFHEKRYNVRIETYKLNPYHEESSLGYKPYFVEMDGEGVTKKAVKTGHGFAFRADERDYHPHPPNKLFMYTLAKDRDHAIELTKGKLDELKKDGKW